MHCLANKLYYLKDWIRAIPGVLGIIPTKWTEHLGCHNILVQKKLFKSTWAVITTMIATEYQNIPPDARPNPLCFPTDTPVIAGLSEDISESSFSNISASMKSFESLAMSNISDPPMLIHTKPQAPVGDQSHQSKPSSYAAAACSTPISKITQSTAYKSLQHEQVATLWQEHQLQMAQMNQSYMQLHTMFVQFMQCQNTPTPGFLPPPTALPNSNLAQSCKQALDLNTSQYSTLANKTNASMDMDMGSATALN